MDESFTTKRLLTLRKLTRAVADLMRAQLKEHLATLAPLLRPRGVLGEHVASDSKEYVKGADAAFKDLQALYGKVAASRPFSLQPELTSPLDLVSGIPEITPVEYVHAAQSGGDSKTVAVTCPLKWVLSYAGFGPRRLRELLAERTRTTNDLAPALQHFLMLNTVLARQPGLVRILEGLRFTLATGPAAGFGELPMVTIASVITTVRPPDALLIESTEVSGADAFEEIVNLGDLANLRDPFREKLVELARLHGEELPAAPAAS
jgi:hypothetical protein